MRKSQECSEAQSLVSMILLPELNIKNSIKCYKFVKIIAQTVITLNYYVLCSVSMI